MRYVFFSTFCCTAYMYMFSLELVEKSKCQRIHWEYWCLSVLFSPCKVCYYVTQDENKLLKVLQMMCAFIIFSV